ncbi:MAG: ATP-binding cassette domain-containing protein [Elusimicrobiota bacterium]|jgi:subfamily B ATP-binding cassette protein MsbA|nr:ATP-binding cassette domain-containing protein [Elusimicrobiota bacterium]
MRKKHRNKKDLKFKVKFLYRKYILQNLFVLNYRRMYPFVKPYWIRACLGVFLTIPVGALDSAAALLLKPFIDNVLVKKEVSFSVYLPFLVIAFTLLQGGFTYAAAYMNTWVGNKIAFAIKRVLYMKLISMDTSFYDKSNSGLILQRFSADADIAASGLISNLKMFITKFFSSLSLIGVLIYNSWMLSIFAVAVLLVAVYPLSLVRKKIKNITQKTVVGGAQLTTLYNETYSGNKVIHSFTLEDFKTQNFDKISDGIFHLSMKMVQSSNWLSPFMHFIGSVGVAIVLGLGSYLILKGVITSGNFVSFVAALMMLYTPLRSIGGNFIAVNSSFLAMDRVFSILNTNPSISSKNGAVKLKVIEKNIEFKDVYFGYDGKTKILKGLSFEIKVGQTVAIVGPSGGGKTTISSLLPRLYDIQKGEILIDGIDIREYTIESLRKNISMVFQDNFLFSGTIRDNILLSNLQVSQEEIANALNNSYLEKFVESLPNKLDTEIGERGILLSGGQKQRVAIARAFLKNAPLVILDEATSALDNKAEQIVQDALDNLMKSKTVIVIAHRLSTVQNADKIIVIDDGKIAEQGTHKELLMLSNGIYASLYGRQFK